jgi:hypothetical protein
MKADLGIKFFFFRTAISVPHHGGHKPICVYEQRVSHIRRIELHMHIFRLLPFNPLITTHRLY